MPKPTSKELMGSHKWLPCRAETEEEARKEFRRRLGREPEKVFRFKTWMFAGPVSEEIHVDGAISVSWPVPEESDAQD